MHACGSLRLVGGCTWRHNNVGGVTAGQVPHNSSNVGVGFAGQVGHNSSISKKKTSATACDNVIRINSIYILNQITIVCHLHTCRLSGFWTDSPSFSSHQNLRPLRLKSPSCEHRRIFFPSFNVTKKSQETVAKVKDVHYPAIHTNYIISHCTTLQYNHNI